MVTQVLGWLGTVAYLTAYILLTTKKIQSDRPLFHMLNIIGAAGLIIHALHLEDFPNVAINLVWGLIAIGAIVYMLRK